MMLNETAFTLASWTYCRAHTTSGIHVTLNQGYNRFIYPIAFILSFSVCNYIIGKLVYQLTANDYIYSLVIQKYKRKQKFKKPAQDIESQNDTIDTMVLIEDKNNCEDNNGENDSPDTVQIDMLSIPEVQYNLWFYRFSIMECVSSCSTWPLLFRILINFGSMHNDCYTFVTWDTYIVECMMIGHYLVDIEEIFSHGYVRRSRDLILHHVIAFVVFFYHLMDAMNFPWITVILFFEINSFFNRFNLVVKFHDPGQTSFVYNVIANLGNFVTMFGVRFALLIRLFVYDIPVSCFAFLFFVLL